MWTPKTLKLVSEKVHDPITEEVLMLGRLKDGEDHFEVKESELTPETDLPVFVKEPLQKPGGQPLW